MATPRNSCPKRSLRTLIVLVMLAVVGRASASEPCPDGLDLEHVLSHYGARALDEVQTLDFTAHFMREGTEISRTWHWDLRTNQVTLSTQNDDGSMLLLAFQSPPPIEASEEVQRADRQFLNDRFWLLFPHRLAWDEGVTVTWTCEPQPVPFGEGAYPLFTALYGAEGGYTPGDAYDFWVQVDGGVYAWSFRRGNAPEAMLSSRFGETVQVGPLRLDLVRLGADGARAVWFSDVAAITPAGVATAVPIPRD